MNENILIYEVRPGDTLGKVAAAIGITADRLKDFHNLHCGTADKLWLDNLAGIRQILIPDPSGNPEASQNQNGFTSICSTRDLFNGSYSVAETFSGSSGSDLEIGYRIDIRNHESWEGSSGTFLSEVCCFDFTKNGAGPDDKMSEVSLACMESIFPITLIISGQGKISGISEPEKLKQRFESKRPDLEDFFTGEVYKAYLDRFRDHLEHKDHLPEQFASTLLCQLVFPEIRWFRQSNEWTGALYFLRNSFPVQCRMIAEYNQPENGTAGMAVKGSAAEPFSLRELLLGTRFTGAEGREASGEMEFRYLIDTTTHKMLQAEASIMVSDAGILYRKHNLKIRQDERKS